MINAIYYTTIRFDLKRELALPITSIVFLAISFTGFLVALTIHEFAHALIADKLGDPNPKIQGRLSLNPLNHIDPVGTVILPLMLAMSRSPVIIGWAKPVRIDPFNLKNRKRDMGLISAAGPMANIILAILASFVLRLLPVTTPAWGIFFLILLIRTNLGLACFNLLPLNPLDGGKVLTAFLPNHLAYRVEEFLDHYGQYLLIFMIFPFFGRSILSLVLNPIIGFLFNLLVPTSILFV